MNLHADAVKVLAGWIPPDDEQQALRDLYLAHLRAHPDGLSRACKPGHITASTAVLDAAGRRVLLTLHHKIGRWLQLGGHCEPCDTTLAAAALREATEESGIADLALLADPVNLDRHAAPCRPTAAGSGGRTWHLDVQFLAIAPPGARPVRGDESDDLRWWPVGSLPASTDDTVRRLVGRACAVSR